MKTLTSGTAFLAAVLLSAAADAQPPTPPQVEHGSGTQVREPHEHEARRVPPTQTRVGLPRDGAVVRSGDAAHDVHTPSPNKAVAVLIPINRSGVSGVVTIKRAGKGVRITGEIRGLEPNGKHGFHIHEFGDLTDRKAGNSAGGHFAPEGTPHGRPTDPAHKRHVGDLGNIEADGQGVARIDVSDEIVSLGGPHGVVGRAFVVHAKADEFTQPSGDAGDRIAFGVIGIAKGERPPGASDTSHPAATHAAGDRQED